MTRIIIKKEKFEKRFATQANESSRSISEVRSLGRRRQPLCWLLSGFVSVRRHLPREDRGGSISYSLRSRSGGNRGFGTDGQRASASHHSPHARIGNGDLAT